MVVHGVCSGGRTVDERHQSNDRGKVRALGGEGEHMAAGEGDAPEHKPAAIDLRHGGCGGERTSVVIELPSDRDGLTGRALAASEAASCDRILAMLVKSSCQVKPTPACQ